MTRNRTVYQAGDGREKGGFWVVGNGTVYRYVDSNEMPALKWLMDQVIEGEK